MPIRRHLCATVFGLGAGAIGLALFGGTAEADFVTECPPDKTCPTADLAVVSNTANLRHAKVGEEVTFTIVATNNGPEATSLDVNTTQATEGLRIVKLTCGRGISSDGPFCEYGKLRPGETVTPVLVAEVQAANKNASDTACVLSEQAIIDPDLSNECATSTVRVVGKRK
jgi:uncharacterized repeat protein (TIGR01451 family)